MLLLQIGPMLPPPPPPPPPPFLVRLATATGQGVCRTAQFGLSGGVAGNTNITPVPGGVAITTGRNGYGNAFHRVVTNPLISPAGAFINWLTR